MAYERRRVTFVDGVTSQNVVSVDGEQIPEI